ncbi:MAG: o-succinylbenzoate synthase [Cytophagaceae bacterium]
MKISWKKHTLQFTFGAGTSRGVMHTKDTWYLIGEHQGMHFYGECGPLKGLSPDDTPEFETKLDQVCKHLSQRSMFAWETDAFALSLIAELELLAYPSIVMGLETLHHDFLTGGQRIIYRTPFTTQSFSIPINGLVWMNDAEHMLQQAIQKVKAGFTCVKFKVGAIDFEKECWVLQQLRDTYPDQPLTIRLDANGAFDETNVWERLEQLSMYEIHSIEQPIKPGQGDLMRQLCKDGAIDIALDEELIGVYHKEAKTALLEDLNPSFIILKPTLLGGFSSCTDWIEQAEHRGIEWWMTSALESNIGLNAIAQYTSTYRVHTPQGLGTGSLYHNNVPSPLEVINGTIRYNKNALWDLSLISGT